MITKKSMEGAASIMRKLCLFTKKSLVILVFFCIAIIQLKATSIPFRLEGKMILIETTVDDKQGYFILDTGTPFLILNEAYFKGLPSGETIVGLLGKEMDLRKTEVNIKMGDLKWNRMQANVLPLDHLSQARNLPILGLLGNRLLRNYSLIIDYETLELELIKSKNKASAEAAQQFPDIQFKFLWRGEMPIIITQVGEEQLRFGLDTGAGINVLNQQKIKGLGERIEIKEVVKVFGINEKGQNLKSGTIRDVIIDKYYCPRMQFVLASMDRFRGFENHLNSVDGFIGYEFLQYFKTVINFKQRTISLYYRNELAENYMLLR